jgi:hypothetical protein
MANPLIYQGVLNKLRGSLSVILLPELNVTASYLGEDGISLAFEGEASAYLPTMTGAVPSPNPYQISTVSIALLRTQNLSAIWKAQMELNTTIGDVVVKTDTATLPNYSFLNCTIKGVGELAVNGRSPLYGIVLQGTYYINSTLFDVIGNTLTSTIGIQNILNL